MSALLRPPAVPVLVDALGAEEAAAAPPGSGGTWFEAPTRFGALRLCATPDAARHAAAAALALHACEDLLAAIDEWTGLEPVWRWIARPTGREAAGARAAWRGSAEPSALQGPLGLTVWPWALLRALPAPPDRLADQLHWEEVPALLSVARFELGRDERDRLEVGGAVVLPPSLRPPWHGMLRSAGEATQSGFGVPVAFDAGCRPRLVMARTRLDASSMSSNRESALCEVRLAIPHTLEADLLAGWYEGEFAEVGPHAGLWRCASARTPAACLATGRLMPWGDGWSLAVEALCESEGPTVFEKV